MCTDCVPFLGNWATGQPGGQKLQLNSAWFFMSDDSFHKWHTGRQGEARKARHVMHGHVTETLFSAGGARGGAWERECGARGAGAWKRIVPRALHILSTRPPLRPKKASAEERGAEKSILS